MSRSLLSASLLALAVCVACSASAARAEAAIQGTEVGRYQLTAAPDGALYLLDTCTGQIWVRYSRTDQWHVHTNPVTASATSSAQKQAEKVSTEKKPDESVSTGPLKLELPEQITEITVQQRRSQFIPGSGKRISIYAGDVTGGQVVVEINATGTGKGESSTLLRSTSMRTGEILPFRVGEESFYIKLAELRNFLVDGDFAVFEVSSNLQTLTKKLAPESPTAATESGSATRRGK